MQSRITQLQPFVGGLNTELTQISEAPQYTVDELNCQVMSDGVRARRYGLGMEHDGKKLERSIDSDDKSVYPLFDPSFDDDIFKQTPFASAVGGTTSTFSIDKDEVLYVVMVGGGCGNFRRRAKSGKWQGKHYLPGPASAVGAMLKLKAGSYTISGGAKGKYNDGKEVANTSDPMHQSTKECQGGDSFLKDSSDLTILKAEGGKYIEKDGARTHNYILYESSWASDIKTTWTVHPDYLYSVIGSYTGAENYRRAKAAEVPTLMKEGQNDLGGPFQYACGYFKEGYGSAAVRNEAPWEILDGGNASVNARIGNSGPLLTNKEAGDGCVFVYRVFEGNTPTKEEWKQHLSNIKGYFWGNYDKKGSNCIVVQKGSYLFFYHAEKPYSQHAFNTAYLGPFVKDKEAFEGTPVSFASGSGHLVVTSKYMYPCYVDLSEDTVQRVQKIDLAIRDTAGIQETIGPDFQPEYLTDDHKYNLLNQGWDEDKIQKFYDSQSKYPSNNLQWFIGKDQDKTFKVEELLKQFFGNALAPRGHYIMNFFKGNRSEVSYVSGATNIPQTNLACSVTYSSGRFFYLVDSTLLFSQVIKEDVRNIEKCYQEADPTSETISDIVSTDGGHITIQDLGEAHKLEQFPLGVLVFGGDSVYCVSTGAGTAFDATNYGVSLVTHSGSYNTLSIVSADGAIFYWSPTGITQITVDQETRQYAVAQNISQQSIQAWYVSLPEYSKRYSEGVYDYVNRKIIWYYPSKDPRETQDTALLDRYLEMDLKTGGFYPGALAEGGYVVDVFATKIPSLVQPDMKLYANHDSFGNEIVMAGDDEIVATEYDKSYDKLVAYSHIAFTDTGGEGEEQIYFADYNSRDFTDWETRPYNSYMVSWPINFGSTYVKKYAPVLQPYFVRTEEGKLVENKYVAESNCMVRARWRWAYTDHSNRWDIQQEGYIKPHHNFLTEHYINGKIRLRGNGEALQLSFSSEGEDDFRLAGINILTRS